ncbi:hypothetical protein X801_03813 [Opisthorchis viverrini]|uniref:Uncharacterized protein n=2 Tax=Opisthorchis viverrini TaxID=6198 RepID=A0A074ZEL4_OPIVI|nr:hypothetical protein T265_06883 [Opisthorchis viverrini]KER25711.1 hypothetical protein T265_06883 [Opisthorchis viverrini]OON20306.1 hypothetical protein X801_03813 [Opisthorchis viverrini]
MLMTNRATGVVQENNPLIDEDSAQFGERFFRTESATNYQMSVFSGFVGRNTNTGCHPIVHTGGDALIQIADNFTPIHITEIALTSTHNWLNMRRKPMSRMLVNPHVDVVILLKEITDPEKNDQSTENMVGRMVS